MAICSERVWKIHSWVLKQIFLICINCESFSSTMVRTFVLIISIQHLNIHMTKITNREFHHSMAWNRLTDYDSFNYPQKRYSQRQQYCMFMNNRLLTSLLMLHDHEKKKNEKNVNIWIPYLLSVCEIPVLKPTQTINNNHKTLINSRQLITPLYSFL